MGFGVRWDTRVDMFIIHCELCMEINNRLFAAHVNLMLTEQRVWKKKKTPSALINQTV